MSYQNTSIKQIVTDIEHNKAYLPAIQRRFVWPRWKIEKLFDSIMRNYPIGSFLFWTLKKEKAKDYVFYEFLKNYDERHPYNKRKNGHFLYEEITGVLDGQQRLSSIYLGLQGTHITKLKNFKRKSSHAYPETKLYLNLLHLPYVENDQQELIFNREFNFEFRFLTDSDAEKAYTDDKQTAFWFWVGDIIGWKDDPEIDEQYDILLARCTDEQQIELFKAQKRIIKKGLRDLHKRLNDPVINYFNIKNDDLEDILEIFIRVNSGGMILSKTDLLFSTIVATWEDGRDVIEKFLQHLNQMGEGYNFNNDFLMRACLVLSDLPVLFKVNSFKSENVQMIKDRWSAIVDALNHTVNLLIDFGFTKETLASHNAIIIVAYFILKGGNITDPTSVENIRKYLLYAHLKNIYGGQGDQIISALRNIVSDKESFKLQHTIFPLQEMLGTRLAANKSLKIDREDINDFMNYKLGHNSFYILSLLYPNNRYSEVYYHQDHIHPHAGFNAHNFSELSLTAEEAQEWLKLKDSVPNLQLLEGKRNTSKNDKSLSNWIHGKDSAGALNVPDIVKYCVDNYIDSSIGFEFKDFIRFYELRKQNLINRLEQILL
ncbi:DUF262 domain-containing protein [Sphingobacterium cellulitidis]|uniref:DUF262 domain-containing protein n=1 Tax=Sphingobacterium cellulitidis TaxID=1768011 RepID=UPI000B93EC9B|nr:hypothetical protein CHT99_08540 [Sphingobacterium cellulitidis]